jgi:hypothetical protein
MGKCGRLTPLDSETKFLPIDKTLASAASYPALRKTQGRGTRSFETGKKSERSGHPAASIYGSMVKMQGIAVKPNPGAMY